MCQSSTHRRGYSRTDLAALTLLFAIVIAIAAPGLLQARQAFAQLACTNNLREIGSAYHAFLKANGGDCEKIQSYPPGWMGQVKGYVKSQPNWIAQVQKKLNLNPSVFCCMNEEPPERKQLPEAEIHISEPWGRGWHELGLLVPLSVNGARIRLSEKVRCADGFALEVEGASNNVSFDWNDLVITVLHQKDGSCKLTAINAITSPYSFSLYNSYGELLVYDFSPSNPQNSYTFPPEVAYSYGMNPAAKKFQIEADDNKVLVAEYKKLVCSVFDMKFKWRERVMATDYWLRDCAPRHEGKLNVLFMNGAVKTLSPGDINPGRPAMAKEYWLPTGFVPEN